LAGQGAAVKRLITGLVLAFYLLFFSIGANAVAVVGDLYNFPNPFNPRIDTNTSIGYDLDVNADIDIYIYTMSGDLIIKKVCPAGGVGGSSTTYNKVPWDGKDTSGNIVGNGMYIYFLVNSGTVIKKSRLVVYQ
jgi:hypothetical protein